jgi:hypothetical protein
MHPTIYVSYFYKIAPFFTNLQNSSLFMITPNWSDLQYKVHNKLAHTYIVQNKTFSTSVLLSSH